jgi:hypothetical protein
MPATQASDRTGRPRTHWHLRRARGLSVPALRSHSAPTSAAGPGCRPGACADVAPAAAQRQRPARGTAAQRSPRCPARRAADGPGAVPLFRLRGLFCCACAGCRRCQARPSRFRQAAAARGAGLAIAVSAEAQERASWQERGARVVNQASFKVPCSKLKSKKH